MTMSERNEADLGWRVRELECEVARLKGENAGLREGWALGFKLAKEAEARIDELERAAGARLARLGRPETGAEGT
jgi:hypothetical protein